MSLIEREAVAAPADDFLSGLREWLADALRRDGWPQVEVWDSGPALPAVFACWPAAVLRDRLGVPIVYLGATLPDDRIHAPNERVVVPLLLRGAEAAARLWRLLPERLS